VTQIITTTPQTIPQENPREGRLALELGISGMAGLSFATGTEVYQWDTNSLQGPQRMSALLSAWVDATAVPVAAPTDPPQFLYVKIGRQTFAIPAGTQTYLVCTPVMPANIIISTNAGASDPPYVVQVILYNYNVNFTGGIATVPGGTVGSQPGASPADVSSSDHGFLGLRPNSGLPQAG
jgi:hypothetical protein